MKIVNIILLVIGITGFICLGSAFTAGHVVYAQVKVMKTEMPMPENRAKADQLVQFTDRACAWFGLAGAIQLAGAWVAFAALRRSQMKRG